MKTTRTSKRRTQIEDILMFMKVHGSITRIEAILTLGIIELPARICEMQAKGYVIPREEYSGTAKNGRKYKSMRYFRPTVIPHE